MALSPLPWTVKYGEDVHRKDSPICRETCGMGRVPLRVCFDGVRYPTEERHVIQILNYVEGIIDAEGGSVYQSANDYDNCDGWMSIEDAEFIVSLTQQRDHQRVAVPFPAGVAHPLADARFDRASRLHAEAQRAALTTLVARWEKDAADIIQGAKAIGATTLGPVAGPEYHIYRRCAKELAAALAIAEGAK